MGGGQAHDERSNADRGQRFEGDLMELSLKGKVALVTGGSYGLGVVFATALTEAGADVALTARSGDLLATVAADPSSLTGREVTAHVGDVTAEADVTRVVGEVIERHGHVDVLVNNAGMSDNTGR